jgi:Spy/CpxP family protein refolding chaperone
MLVRTITIVSLFLMTTGMVLAQSPVPEKDVVFFSHGSASSMIAPGSIPEEIMQKAKAALNLSDVQVTAIKALLTMRSQSSEQIHQDALAAGTKLQELLSSPNPNATEVGTAYLAVRNVQDRYKAVQEKFRTDFQALLTAEQRANLASLESASERIDALRFLGVIGSLHDAVPMPMPLPAFGGASQFQRKVVPRQ